MCVTKYASARLSLPPKKPCWDPSAATLDLAHGCLQHWGGTGDEQDGGAGRDLPLQFSPICLFFYYYYSKELFGASLVVFGKTEREEARR